LEKSKMRTVMRPPMSEPRYLGGYVFDGFLPRQCR
jgi:hypothetical protein